jgi:hypothetical protein
LCDCLSLKGKENAGALPVDTFTWREAKKHVREWGTARSPTGVRKVSIRLRLLEFITMCFLYVCSKHFFIEISSSRMCFAIRFVKAYYAGMNFQATKIRISSHDLGEKSYRYLHEVFNARIIDKDLYHTEDLSLIC